MKHSHPSGFSLIELVISMAMASILIAATSILLIQSDKSFKQVYESANGSVQQDSKVLTSVFGAMARKSNRTNYVVYKIINGQYIEAVPDDGETIAYGQAVELRYWDRPFYELVQGMDRIDIEDTGSHYALFYLNDEKICLDIGEVENGIGAVHNGSRKTDTVRTQVLVEQIDESHKDIFSHEVIGGQGTGCITLNVKVGDDSDDSITIKMASLVRIVWPQ